MPNVVKTGAILCGGKSSRMGSPKSGVSLPNGLTMIEHVYLALSKVCEQVVFVGHGEGVSSALLSRGLHVTDEIPNLGPLGALDALLSSGIDSQYLITPCDLFRVTPDLFHLLDPNHSGSPLLFRHADKIEPLIGIYHETLLPTLRIHMKQKRLAIRDLLSDCDPGFIEVPEALLSTLSNANSPQDVAYL